MTLKSESTAKIFPVVPWRFGAATRRDDQHQSKAAIAQLARDDLTERQIAQSYSAQQFALAAVALLATMMFSPSQVSAAPTAEVAKRCLHYAYIVYPRKRPGAAPASGDREAYFRDCLSKDGEVPEPERSPK